MKGVTSTLARGFVCVDVTKGIVKPSEEILLFDQVEFVNSFCYLGDRLNASDGR